MQILKSMLIAREKNQNVEASKSKSLFYMGTNSKSKERYLLLYDEIVFIFL